MVWRYPQVPGHPAAAANGPRMDASVDRSSEVSPLAELSLPAPRLSESGAATGRPGLRTGQPGPGAIGPLWANLNLPGPAGRTLDSLWYMI